jgi:polyisoprenoid-binding protein YceI
MKVPYSNILRIASMLGLMLCLCLSLSAQNLYQLAGKPELKVMGGSTLHDWEMVASNASGKAAMTIENQSIQAIHMAEVTMKSTALKSGNGKMDEIAYKALKTDKNPDLYFRLITFKNLGGNRASVTGNLTIAGTTKPVSFEVYYQVKKQIVELTGETSFKMTDFKVSPPTAMLGTIKTDDKIKISFKANFNLINPL